MLNKIKVFLSEIRAEMQKISWPTRQELVSSTGVVLITMFIISTFIGVADLVLTFVLKIFLR